jgi:hypothetical protein
VHFGCPVLARSRVAGYVGARTRWATSGFFEVRLNRTSNSLTLFDYVGGVTLQQSVWTFAAGYKVGLPFELVLSSNSTSVWATVRPRPLLHPQLLQVHALSPRTCPQCLAWHWQNPGLSACAFAGLPPSPIRDMRLQVDGTVVATIAANAAVSGTSIAISAFGVGWVDDVIATTACDFGGFQCIGEPPPPPSHALVLQVELSPSLCWAAWCDP